MIKVGRTTLFDDFVFGCFVFGGRHFSRGVHVFGVLLNIVFDDPIVKEDLDFGMCTCLFDVNAIGLV